MKFQYVKMGTTDPIFPLGDVMHRFRPIIEIGIIGPRTTLFRKATLDSGADDTIFPLSLAEVLGIDLTNAPMGKATVANGTSLQYYYAEVGLQLTSVGGEKDEKIAWTAIVGFAESRKKKGLLGHAGMLQYFDVAFFGEHREVIVTPNSTLPGEWTFKRRTRG
jgi:hypothetical protein